MKTQEKDNAVKNFETILLDREEDGYATFPELIDELNKLLIYVYLMWVSNVAHKYDNTVMKDMFGGNKQHLNIFVTWMVVLDQNSGKDFWDTEEDFLIMRALLNITMKVDEKDARPELNTSPCLGNAKVAGIVW
jgi:hypothetical protein